jgi:hypothetical protein
MKIGLLAAVLMLAVLGYLSLNTREAQAGETPSASGMKVLAPIRQGNLTVFPVVAARTHDTSGFLTLDEGLRSGEVVVTESGQVMPMMRRRPRMPAPSGQAQVNRLVLINNSQRPLLLLAGEIVTGGKQDRVIGKDRIVPAESDAVDLSVFCVEPGRWTGASAQFGARDGYTYMAAPKVRKGAMDDKDQHKVWDEVRSSQSAMAEAVPQAAPVVGSTSSYARVMENQEVKRELEGVAVPLERDYSRLIHELKNQSAVGVVVAVNGEVIWADIFASTELLEKYWPKLVRSYAAEALQTRGRHGREVSTHAAQEFLDTLDGTHETVEREPGLYRHSEIKGDGYKVFELASLLPKMSFDVHVAKMAE